MSSTKTEKAPSYPEDFFEKTLDGIGRAEVESRYRKAVFMAKEMETTLGIVQERSTRLYLENQDLKNAIRAAIVLLEGIEHDDLDSSKLTGACSLLISALDAKPEGI